MGRAFVALGLHLVFFRYLSFPGASHFTDCGDGATDRDTTAACGDPKTADVAAFTGWAQVKENVALLVGKIGTNVGLSTTD